MQQLAKDYTIIIVTHNMQQASRISDYTCFLLVDEKRSGYLVEYGETEELFINPKDKRTEDYIMAVVRRITLVGAVFLGLIAVLPGIMALIGTILRIPGLEQSAYVISGAGLIIVVGVVIDTMRQLEAQLLMRHYEGFIS